MQYSKQTLFNVLYRILERFVLYEHGLQMLIVYGIYEATFISYKIYKI